MHSRVRKHDKEVRVVFYVAVKFIKTAEIMTCFGFKSFIHAKRLSETLRDCLEFYGKQSWKLCVEMDLFALRNLELQIEERKKECCQRICEHKELHSANPTKMNMQFYFDFLRNYEINSQGKFRFFLNNLLELRSNPVDRFYLESIHYHLARHFKYGSNFYVNKFNTLFNLVGPDNVGKVQDWFKYLHWLGQEVIYQPKILLLLNAHRDLATTQSDQVAHNDRIDTLTQATLLSLSQNTKSIRFWDVEHFIIPFMSPVERHKLKWIKV
jgi:hypothetical protein